MRKSNYSLHLGNDYWAENTSILLKYPSLYIRMYGYAFRRTYRSRAETWHGSREQAPRFESIFSKLPHQKSKVSQKSSYFRNALWPPHLVGRAPDQRVMNCWDHRSCSGQPGSTRGQIAQECPIGTKFDRKNPWPKSSILLGSKVMQRLIGVNQGSNC